MTELRKDSDGVINLDAELFRQILDAIPEGLLPVEYMANDIANDLVRYVQTQYMKINFVEMDIQHPEMDCDFYYFKPGGKWKYHGEGMFPDNDGKEEWYDVNRKTIVDKNKCMPGVVNDVPDLVIVVIPRGGCKARFAYPRMIQPERFV